MHILSTWMIFAGSALVISTGALWIACVALLRLRQSRAGPRVAARLSSLETDQAWMADEIQKLAKLAKKRASREAVRESRARKAAQDQSNDQTESDQEWVKRKNLELALRR